MAVRNGIDDSKNRKPKSCIESANNKETYEAAGPMNTATLRINFNYASPIRSFTQETLRASHIEGSEQGRPCCRQFRL